MTSLLEIYQCQICTNVVEVVRAGKGQLVCCGQPMTALTENTVDASREKHVPAVTVTDEQMSVAIGSVAHPMEDKHYIEWIEAMDGSRTCRTYLKPGDPPQARFGPGFSTARAFCNLHGLWKAEAQEVSAVKYVCNVCGYVYDPEQGDPDGNVAPGTPFEQLPTDWVCPVCGAAKREFSPEA